MSAHTYSSIEAQRFFEAHDRQEAEKARQDAYSPAADRFIQEKANIVQEATQRARNEKAATTILERVKSVPDAIANGIPPIKWRIQNLLSEGGICIIASPPKQFKTFAAIHAAISVSTGTPFLDTFNTNQGSVLYIDEENGERTLLRRFNQIAEGHETSIPSHVHYVSFGLIKLDTPEGETMLDALIRHMQPSLVILDSMVRFIEGDEDRASDVRRVFETLKTQIDTHPTLSFLILNHTRKGNGRKKKGIEDLRGSSDFGAFADCVLGVEAMERGFEFRVLANRLIGLQEVQPLYIEVVSDRQEGPIRFANRGADATSRKGKAKQALLAWFRDTRREEFRTSEALGHLGTLSIGKHAYHEARDELLSEGIIAENRPGYYRVQPGVVADEQEVVP